MSEELVTKVAKLLSAQIGRRLEVRIKADDYGTRPIARDVIALVREADAAEHAKAREDLGLFGSSAMHIGADGTPRHIPLDQFYVTIEGAAVQLSARPADMPGLWIVPGHPELTTGQLIALANKTAAD